MLEVFLVELQYILITRNLVFVNFFAVELSVVMSSQGNFCSITQKQSYLHFSNDVKSKTLRVKHLRKTRFFIIKI